MLVVVVFHALENIGQYKWGKKEYKLTNDTLIYIFTVVIKQINAILGCAKGRWYIYSYV